MSSTDNKLGPHLVDRVRQLCPMPHARIYVKKKLLTLPAEDRDEYLGYLEDQKDGMVRDDKLTEGENDE